ncbi:hypothetical protein CAOG_03058 [Capsaspora owczarzaki ATCC 30864]|uniref:TKL/IRAK protein kinase n=1 Tax=Capsaspora owczarzaki (strain ATCC 30864) TaxID=595528 RepID=A0A0D2VNS9_CAPO3|nr:hypothetical protein CAOG_03058 [Capsaspora owczarzaki ATCC 30864]KJE92022.1 TKL/IRAK protein kinase [Capsaspora owczarzaki ATCC 30864]|eukprot:XP_004363897.2 hypothetical protein CAOG_03058 [Capsaspora owczarzaki ATCC 30864]
MLSYQNMTEKQQQLFDTVEDASQLLDLCKKQIGNADAKAVAEAIKVNTTMTELKLGGNLIADVGARAIAEAVRANCTLTVVDLTENRIGDAGARAFAETLKVNNTLTKLDLDENQIGDAGAQAIAEALKVNKTLTTLGLWQNQIGAAGAQAIADALKVNTTLTDLALYQNKIGDDGAQAIAEALEVNTTLTELYLWENQITCTGAQALAEALKANTTVTKLDLGSNQIGDAGARAIAEALKVNETLTMLYLNNNFLTTDGIAAFRQTGNAICDLDLDDQRAPSNDELAQIFARTSAAITRTTTLEAENQKVRFELAAKDQELAAKDQELQQLRSDLAAKDLELKSALDRIDVLKRNQPGVGSAANFDGPIPRVSLATLVTATNNFAAKYLLGEGAFGRVYGASVSGSRVAIKKLSAESKQGSAEFKSELHSLAKFRHPNVVAILSYAEDGDERCLVYEFMPNGSVRDRLNRKNNTPPLTWSQRHRIAADVARGMHYIQGAFSDKPLFHFDLKTDNVLLDAHFNAKVSDFGLFRAAQHLDEKSYICTQLVQGAVPQLVQGAAPYMCPEFFEEGRMTNKTAVYAFGMILLELLTALKPSNRLKGETRKAVKSQKFLDMLDSALNLPEAEQPSVSEIVTLALECLDDIIDDRPSFGSILTLLDS